MRARRTVRERPDKAAIGSRTRDLLITNEVLYQLSYSSNSLIGERPSIRRYGHV